MKRGWLLLLCACAGAKPLPAHNPPAWAASEVFYVDPNPEASLGAGDLADAAVKHLNQDLLADGLQPGSPADAGTLIIKIIWQDSFAGQHMGYQLRRGGRIIADESFKLDQVSCYSTIRFNHPEECVARFIANGIEDLPVLAAEHSAAAQPVTAARPQLSGKLAVLDLRLQTRELRETDSRYFTDVIRAAVLRLEPQLDVMTRENLLVLLHSTGKDLANCEGECEVDTGRRIGADEIISGELVKVGTRFKLSMRLHETHEGRLLGASVASGNTIDQLDDSTNKAVAALFEGTR